jgi:CheY-like chemotaxis protein
VQAKHLRSTDKVISLLISIKDTGIGIPEDKFETIFEEFKQSSSSTTREYGGTGLGLPIVKMLLGAMGAEIKLKSEPGKGSEFYFEIDFLIGDKRKIRKDQKDIVFDDSLKGVRVLLVEDNKINQMVASKFLKEWKCRVDVAENGKVALEKLIPYEYDVILMDLQMPVMDGYTATETIRSLEDAKLSSIPIIALSASALGQIETRARKYGMNDFVTKPFVPKVLFTALVKHSRKPG